MAQSGIGCGELDAPHRNATMKSWKDLFAAASRLRFEPHNIAAELDARGHYAVELDEEFPLLMKLFH